MLTKLECKMIADLTTDLENINKSAVQELVDFIFKYEDDKYREYLVDRNLYGVHNSVVREKGSQWSALYDLVKEIRKEFQVEATIK